MRIGLTGGIGSGKSTVAQMLVEKGAVLIDADAIARELMSPGESVLAQTVAEFGNQILTETGELNRQKLAQEIFADESARARLNAIVHPAVRARSQELVQAAVAKYGDGVVIVEDIPLLTETSQADRFDTVVVVFAELSVRLKRLVETRGMDEADARARIAAQASDEDRAAIATWVLDNSGSLKETRKQVEKMWEQVVSEAAIPVGTH